MVSLNIIFNRNNRGIIGVGRELLCYIPEDMKWFKQITQSSENNAVIMVYNTWLSIKKPLPGRKNIVLSKRHISDIIDPNVATYNSFEEAFEDCQSYNKIFIIGGVSLYEYVIQNYIDIVDTIYQVVNNCQLSDCNMEDDKQIHLLSENTIRKASTFGNKKLIKERRGLSCLPFGKTNTSNKEEHIKVDCLFEKYIVFRGNQVNEYQYLDLLNNVLSNGTTRLSRNSTVISLFGEKMTFDLRIGFPLLTTKKMGWKTILRELLWFLNGSTNNKLLQDKNVHIWDKNASKEFLQSRGLSYEEGDLGPIYGFQWRHFGENYRGMNESYEGGVDQVQNVIDLINNDPLSRRIILSAWNPPDLDKMALPPCHILVQFYVDVENGYLDAQLYQRSGDMFLGVPYNIASYSMLLHIIAKLTNYKPRFLYHVIGDAHIYENHVDVVEKQLNRVPYIESADLVLSDDIKTIDTIDESMFQLNNYKSDSILKSEMIA